MSGPSPSSPADGSRDPDAGPPGGLPAKLKEIAATALVTGGVTTLFAVLTDGVRALGTGLALLVCAMIGLAVAVLLTLGRFARLLRRWLEPAGRAVARRRAAGRPAPGMPGRRHRRLEGFVLKLSAGYLGVLLGAAAVTVPWGVVQGGTWLSHRIWPPDCERPLELRVVTAPENVTALRESIALFVQGRLVDGCAPYTISVGVAPSVGELAYAFGDNWYRDDARQEGDEPFRRLYGPRADAWVATSTGEARLVAEDVGAGGATLDIGPSVASDRLVVGMISGRAEKVRKELPAGRPGSHSLPVLWKVVRSKFGMPVSYPQPELSTAGLVAVSDLMPLGDIVDREQRDIVAESVSSLLCRFRTASRGTGGEELNRSPALVIPFHSLTDYNDGRFNDPHCPEGAPSGMTKLKEFFSPGLSGLDYPFVTISWPDERSAERTSVLGLLRSWLAANPLFGERSAERAVVRSPAALREAQSRFFGLLPRLDAEIALDVSGSMTAPPRSLLVRLRETFPDIKPLITPRDDLALSAFSTVGRRTRVRELQPAAGRAEFDELTRSVAGTRAEGSDAPISDMIMNLNRRAGSPGRALVVVTDGGVFDNERRGKGVGGTLARASNVNALYVLALGDNGCDRSPPRAGKYRECVEAGADMRQALRHLISSLRGKDRR
ncbi:MULTISPECIES: vWA domain-containing protein [unclassified Streptosporangium]|uniref:vWA domain-containing protein n=1 Tax=Streptosporangium sp. NPDC005286 TaxID=3154463 RepID=UPI0033AAE7EE